MLNAKTSEKKSAEKTARAAEKSEVVSSVERSEKFRAERAERMERAKAAAAEAKTRRELNLKAEREALERGRPLRTESTPMYMNDAETAEQDAVVDFFYGGVVNASISSRFIDDDFFLPITELFTLLRINHVIDPRTRRIIGRFGLKQVPYVIDVEKKVITLDDKVFSFAETEFVTVTGEIYFNSKVLERVFGWTLTSNLRSLTVNLQTDEDLPIMADRRREQNWQQLQRMGMIGAQMGANAYYPLINDVGISRPLIDGGGLGYNLSASMSGARMLSNNIGVNGGFRILGGDATINSSGSYITSTNRAVLQSNWQWRFALEENNWLQSITAGVLPTQGITPMQVQGARFTNEPLQPRIFFDFTEIDGELSPADWRAVELRRGLEVLDYKKIDSTGKYSFSVPRFQGVTMYTLRKYGITGEVEDESYVYNIPAAQWQPGRFVYSLTGGRDQQTGLWSGNGTATIGIFDWLSNTTGVDYQYQSFFFPRPLVYNSSHLRLLRSTALSVDIVSDALVRATAQTFFSNASILDASYTRFNQNSLFTGAIRSLSAGGAGAIDRSTVSFNIASPLGLQGLSTRFAGVMDRTTNGNQYQYTADLFTNISSLMLMTSYRGSYRKLNNENTMTHFVNGSVMYSIQGMGIFNGTMINSGYSIDLSEKKVQALTMSIARPLIAGAMINASMNYTPITKSFSGAINLMWNLGVVQASAGTNFMPNAAPTTTMALQGAMSINPQTGAINFAAMNWIGTGSAAFRPFIDENGNGVFDAGERIVDVRILPAFGGMMQQSGDYQSVIGMPSYSRVNATIDEETLPNPLYRPKYPKFSFYAEPNTFKAVDVPFIVAGVLEGTVRKLISGVPANGVGGLRMRIRGTTDTTYRKTIITFTDGTYFLEGVPPGDYLIEPDTNQIALLGATASPAIRNFTIKTTAEGDMVNDINFDVNISRAITQKEEKKILATEKQKLYYIVLGAAASRTSGDSIAQALAKNYGLSVTVQNVSANAFAVTTGVYETRVQLDSALDQLISKSHYGAYTVVDPEKCPTPVTTYRLLLKSFEKRVDAEAFITANRSKYSSNIEMDFDMATKQYIIVAATRYATYAEAQSKTGQFTGSFRDALVSMFPFDCGKPTFTVIAGTYTTYTEAMSVAADVEKQSGMPMIVWFDKVASQFVVSAKKNMPTKLDAESSLRTLLSKTKMSGARILEN